MLESLPDINVMENLSTALAAIAGFALAFGQRIWSGVLQAASYAARPFSGLWLRVRLMVASKRLYDLLHNVLEEEFRAASKAGRNVNGSAIAASMFLKDLGSDLEVPAIKPKRGSRKRRTGDRITTPAAPADGDQVKAAPDRQDRRFTTPAEDEQEPAGDTSTPQKPRPRPTGEVHPSSA